MTGAYHRRADDEAQPPLPLYDRELDPFVEIRIRRLWARGHDAYHIATALRLRYSRVQGYCDTLEAETGGQRTDDRTG